MNKINIIILSVLIFSVSLSAQTALQKQVDSLFVIASSGELKYRDLVDPAIEKIAELGAPAVPLLVDKLDTKSARERLTLINILKKIGSDAVPYLITSLKNPNDLIVQRVCWALGDIKDSSAVQPLIGVINHPRWHVRDQAIGALGGIGDKIADDAVITGFADEIGQVRKAAAVSAGKLKILESLSLLIHQLGDEFYGARMSAFESILKFDTTFVIEKLADSITSQNNFVSSLSCELLGRIATDRAIDVLYDHIDSPNLYLREKASLALTAADPKDLCGFRNVILQNVTDRLSLLKIESLINSYDDQEKPDR